MTVLFEEQQAGKLCLWREKRKQRKFSLLAALLPSGSYAFKSLGSLPYSLFYRNAHIYGIDLADTKELVAYNRTEEDVAKHIGADAVIYQTLPDLVASCTSLNPQIKNFEVGVFSGKYVTPVAPDYFERLERIRGQSSLKKRREAAITAVAAGVANVGDVEHVLNRVKPNGEQNEIKVKETMDCSIHNFGDYVDVSKEAGEAD
jgi:amidophosphoribosyltransferase